MLCENKVIGFLTKLSNFFLINLSFLQDKQKINFKF